MGITHKWNGTVLTITSDSGTSSMDLKGDKGNKGCRGPQGRAGCIVKPDGTVDTTGYATETYVDEKILDAQFEMADLSNYYTKEETVNLLDNMEITADLTSYAKKTDIPTNVSAFTNDAKYSTEEYVGVKIAEAKLEGSEVDLSVYATKSYVDNAVDNADIDLTGYATETYVNDAIANIDLPDGGVGKAGTGIYSEIFNNYANNEASGHYSHAEGSNTIASGDFAHAEGSSTKASGIYGSHAEGYKSEARGNGTHAEGYSTEAIGNYCHAEGNNTRAIGSQSHVEGRGTISEGAMQHVEGEYNAVEEDTNRLEYAVNTFKSTRGKYVHVVGNGTSDTERSNCHTLDWNGNAWFAGKVYVGGTSMDDAVELGGSGGSVDLSNYYNKTEVDNKIASIGSGGTVDLGSYATKSYVTGLGYQTEEQVLALIQANMPASGDGVSY